MEDQNLMLFVNNRPSRADAMPAPLDSLEKLRDSESLWAKRAGLENAPYRVNLNSRTDFSTVIDTATNTTAGDITNDKQSPDYAESEYSTDRGAGNLPVRDKQSPD